MRWPAPSRIGSLSGRGRARAAASRREWRRISRGLAPRVIVRRQDVPDPPRSRPRDIVASAQSRDQPRVVFGLILMPPGVARWRAPLPRDETARASAGPRRCSRARCLAAALPPNPELDAAI